MTKKSAFVGWGARYLSLRRSQEPPEQTVQLTMLARTRLAPLAAKARSMSTIGEKFWGLFVQVDLPHFFLPPRPTHCPLKSIKSSLLMGRAAHLCAQAQSVLLFLLRSLQKALVRRSDMSVASPHIPPRSLLAHRRRAVGTHLFSYKFPLRSFRSNRLEPPHSSSPRSPSSVGPFEPSKGESLGAAAAAAAPFGPSKGESLGAAAAAAAAAPPGHPSQHSLQFNGAEMMNSDINYNDNHRTQTKLPRNRSQIPHGKGRRARI